MAVQLVAKINALFLGRCDLYFTLVKWTLLGALISTVSPNEDCTLNLNVTVPGKNGDGIPLVISVDPSQPGNVHIQIGHSKCFCTGEEVDQLIDTSTQVSSTDAPTTAVVTELPPTTQSHATTVADTNTGGTSDEPSYTSGYTPVPGFGLYKLYTAPHLLKWSDARSTCVRDGGELMVIESKKEKENVYDKIYRQLLERVPWLGIYDVGENGTWITVHGEPVPMSWWGHQDIEGHCAAAFEDGLLRKYPCSGSLSFICEQPEEER